MLLSHPPKLIKSIYPSLVWKIKTAKKEFSLTFDDGPITNGDATSIILDVLDTLGIPATFYLAPGVGLSTLSEKCDIVLRMAQAGHEIESQSSLKFPRPILDTKVLEQMIRTELQ